MVRILLIRQRRRILTGVIRLLLVWVWRFVRWIWRWLLGIWRLLIFWWILWKRLFARCYYRGSDDTFSLEYILYIFGLNFPQIDTMFRICINHIEIFLRTFSMIQRYDMFLELISGQVVILKDQRITILIGTQSFWIYLLRIDVFRRLMGLRLGWILLIDTHYRWLIKNLW